MNHFACTLLHCACPWEGDCLFCFVFVYLNDFCVGIVSILSVIYIFQNTLINVVVIAMIFSSLLHVFEEFGFCFRHLHSSAGERLFITVARDSGRLLYFGRVIYLFFLFFFPSTKFSTSLGRFSRKFATRRGMC